MKFLKYNNQSDESILVYFCDKNLERNKSQYNNYNAIILYCQINVFFPFNCD